MTDTWYLLIYLSFVVRI